MTDAQCFLLCVCWFCAHECADQCNVLGTKSCGRRLRFDSVLLQFAAFCTCAEGYGACPVIYDAVGRCWSNYNSQLTTAAQTCVLQAHPNSIALFVPAEITTYCFYPGKVKDYLVANAIFRMGGAAVMMTNKPSMYRQCKYQLNHAVRVHTGQDDAAYRYQ